MDAIGGYFELADYEEGLFPHQEGILLNTGRNALEYILRSIGSVQGIYLPYYTCEVVLEPLKKLQIPWTYYHINERFEIVDEIHPKQGEYIIANNYFGIKDRYIQAVAEKYGDHLIVDCAQALFAKPIPGIKCFYSPRKFVGVADGGIAYLGSLSGEKVMVSETDCSSSHDSHLLKRKVSGPEAGFADFQENEKRLDNQSIRLMSDTTKRILYHIDYDQVITKRRANFACLHEALKDHNLIQLPELNSFACPMVYPYMTTKDRELRKELIEHKVFVAKYWHNVHQLADYEVEYVLANQVMPIPCDQRYGDEEMCRIIEIIKQ